MGTRNRKREQYYY